MDLKPLLAAAPKQRVVTVSSIFSEIPVDLLYGNVRRLHSIKLDWMPSSFLHMGFEVKATSQTRVKREPFGLLVVLLCLRLSPHPGTRYIIKDSLIDIKLDMSGTETQYSLLLRDLKAGVWEDYIAKELVVLFDDIYHPDGRLRFALPAIRVSSQSQENGMNFVTYKANMTMGPAEEIHDLPEAKRSLCWYKNGF